MATFETNDNDFEKDVIEASKSKPVVVDCGLRGVVLAR